jgi:GT2 family glycosyltransferase
MDAARVSVIICAFTFDRLSSTVVAARSAVGQDPAPLEVIVVIDHNDELADRLARELPDLTVVTSHEPQGLSGARNAGIAASRGDVLVFLDDDAVPQPGWLAGLLAPFSDPRVAIVGGRAIPEWEGDAPGWFPPEFLWVVGCSYRGQATTGPVRNPIGCSMAVRRSALESVDGFDPAVGRFGRVPLGADETDLSLRIRAADPDAQVVMAEASIVRHHVPRSRQRPGYFLRRCFYEGISKAQVADISGSGALDTERAYVRRALPSGFLAAGLDAVRGPARLAALGRAAAIVGGLAVTVAGYGYGRLAMLLPGGTRRARTSGAPG